MYLYIYIYVYIYKYIYVVKLKATVEYSETGHFADDGKQASGRAWIKLSIFNGRKCKTNIQGAPPGAQPCGLADTCRKRAVSLKHGVSYSSWPRSKTSLPVQSLSQ